MSSETATCMNVERLSRKGVGHKRARNGRSLPAVAVGAAKDEDIV